MLAADTEMSTKAVRQTCLSSTSSAYFLVDPELIPLPFVVTSLSLGCFITEAEKKGLFKERSLPAVSPGRPDLADALPPEVT